MSRGDSRKFPKALLHEFYQLHGNEISCRLSFQVEPGPGFFKCTVACPGVQKEPYNFDDFSVSAEGKNKKASMHEAALRALLHLQDLRMLPAYMQPGVRDPVTGGSPPVEGPTAAGNVAEGLERLCSQLIEGITKGGEGTADAPDAAVHSLSKEQLQTAVRTAYWGLRELAASVKTA